MSTQIPKTMVLLGVSGCIAAYKSCELVRLLQKLDFDVKVAMTKSATRLVGPSTFRALTGYPVALDLFEDPQLPIHHISLANEADIFVIAPATANVIAKIANGVADDLLTTTAVAYKGQMVIAPAMNDAMYADETVVNNLDTLRSRGVLIVEPDDGYLACGTSGRGRLADISNIADAVIDASKTSSDLVGKKVVITAGPTVEAIDPVRYISNYSSGKMGYALAFEAVARGAEVVLISGPTAIKPPEAARVINVISARQTLDSTLNTVGDTDFVYCVAAVADYRPASPAAEQKIKKHQGAQITIELVENPDILATLGSLKHKGKLSATIIGFAAETEDIVVNGRGKLIAKQCDMIVANDVRSDGLGFNSDNNAVTVITSEGLEVLESAPKRVIARGIIDAVCKL